MVWKVPGTTILPFLSRWNEGLPYITSIHHTNCSLCGCYAQRECDSPTMFFIGGVTVLWDTTYKSKDIPERWASKNLSHYVYIYIYIYYVFSNLFNANLESSGSFREFPVQRGDVVRHPLNFTKFPKFWEENRPHQHPPFKFCSDKPRSNKSVDFWYFRISPWGQVSYIRKLCMCTHRSGIWIASTETNMQTIPYPTRTEITYIKLHVLLRCISIQY